MKMKLKNVTPNTKIRHRNEINTTLSQLPLSARRLIFMAIAQVEDTKKMIPEGEVFRIRASEYAEVADINVSLAYRQMKEGAEILQNSTLAVPREQLIEPFKRDGSHSTASKRKIAKDAVRVLNITDYCEYSESAGYIDICFTRTMEPYISLLAGGYTTQVLLSATRLSEGNASSLYQLVRKNISMGKIRYFEVYIDDLKDELGLFTVENGIKTYQYEQFKSFTQFFLKRSVETIKEVTELKDLSYEVCEKLGRKATKLRFSYTVSKAEIEASSQAQIESSLEKELRDIEAAGFRTK